MHKCICSPFVRRIGAGSIKRCRAKGASTAPVHQLQKAIVAICCQELAQGVTALAYRIEMEKNSLFEIAVVPEKTIEALSPRIAAIDARLAERGTSRAEASAVENHIAALDTREAKGHAGHSESVAEGVESFLRFVSFDSRDDGVDHSYPFGVGRMRQR